MFKQDQLTLKEEAIRKYQNLLEHAQNEIQHQRHLHEVQVREVEARMRVSHTFFVYFDINVLFRVCVLFLYL